MITEEQRYRAYSFNVLGFALMVPLGKAFIDFNEYIEALSVVGYIIYLIICVGVAIIGFMAVEHGRSILDIYRRG